MKRSITPGQIKRNNRQLIYEYIYEHPRVSQQDISYELKLSRPTVANNLASLEEEGFIEKAGLKDSGTVGRKAMAFQINAQKRIAIGVDHQVDSLHLAAVDLNGELVKFLIDPLPFENTEDYYQAAAVHIQNFIDSVKISDDQILGVGIAMQGLVSPDGTHTIYGKIVNFDGLTVDQFSQYLPYPVKLRHDAACGAISELWENENLTNAMYLFVGWHLGAEIIYNRKLVHGMHGHPSSIEHLPLFSKKKKCYCGNYGCAETECCLSAVIHEGEDIDEFFNHVRNNDPSYIERWETFLRNMAVAINAAHLIADFDYVLGGTIAPYLTESDIRFLHKEVAKLSPFNDSDDFIHISRMPEHNIPIGAALPYLEDYLDSLF